MNNLFYWVIGIVILLGGVWYFTMNKNENAGMQNNNATTTADNTIMATDTSATTTMASGTSSTTLGTNAPLPRAIPGYPSSWPSDVPKYPVELVKYTGGNNPQSGPIEATVVFSTPDSVKSVINFYLAGLKANGWKITEDGKGLSNLITIRATKGRRQVGAYAVRETNGKTTVTVGVNIGI